MLRRPPLLLVLLFLLLASVAAAQAPPPPNIVVILTDDQRFDSLPQMPLTLAALASRGVTFSRAFVTNPVCAPSRASLLSGGFVSHSTGVVDNNLPNGGVAIFDDSPSLPGALQAAGYATGLFGKYMNQYTGLAIPPGWTRFEAALGIALDPTSFVVGSSTALPSVGTYSPIITQYGTDYLRDRALAFIDQHAGTPFFLYLPFAAPHTPATPAPQDANLFPDYVYRERGFGEDVSDKPLRVQIAQSQYWTHIAADDALHRDQMRCLQSVDRAVDAIVARLAEQGLLENTVIVYSTDNGYLWGEHGLVGKGEGYDESLRVPLVIAAPGVVPGTTDDRLVAMNLDLPATLLDFAGVTPFGDGTSLVPLLQNPGLPGRSATLIESDQQWRVWAGLTVDDATGKWKYVEDANGDRELYDLAADPYELTNLASVPQHQAMVASLAAQLAPQKGLAIKPGYVAPPAQGQPYLLQLHSWGGVPPLTWSIDYGQLPAGLSLNPSSGAISGTPANSAGGNAMIRVTDSSTVTQTGRPQTYAQLITFPSLLPACSDGIDNDGDGLVDLADPGCASASDTSEQGSGIDCNDGIDNDGDGLVDLADPGCSSIDDPTETSPSLPCDDGIDNDGDGMIDHADLGCPLPTDPDEKAPGIACDDGIDNDGDGLVDLADPGCSSAVDLTETRPDGPQCDDGIDNDGDGKIDMADPACLHVTDNLEGPVCNDGHDNDGDGKIDYPDDPGCTSIFGTIENPICDDGIDNDNDGLVDWADPQCKPNQKVDREARLPSCGLGAELVLVLAAVMRRRNAARA